MKKTYLDNAAATPVLPEVLEAMLPYLKEAYGNAQALHSWGDEARSALETARTRVAGLIGGLPEEIVFTASGSEANNMALKGLAQASQRRGKHVIISAVEHFSVLHAAKTLEKWGYEVSLAPVDGKGRVDPDTIAGLMRKDTTVVSVMHANGEVGTIEPVAEIAKVVKSGDALFHTDAVASAGSIPVDVNELGVDALTLAGSQFYGPKGGAALWLKSSVRIMPLIDGGVQEGGKRAGTEDVAAIAGFGKAAELAARDLAERAAHVRELRDRLMQGVLSGIADSYLTGDPQERLPGNASFCIDFIEGEAMLLFLNLQGIAASSGSACTSRALKSSHVLTAMGVPAARAQGSLLFTFGRQNGADDVQNVLQALPPIVERLRQMSPLYAKAMSERKGRR